MKKHCMGVWAVKISTMFILDIIISLTQITGRANVFYSFLNLFRIRMKSDLWNPSVRRPKCEFVWDLWLNQQCSILLFLSSFLLYVTLMPFFHLPRKRCVRNWLWLFRVLVESRTVCTSCEPPFCNLCREKDWSEAVNSDGSVAVLAR